MTSPADETLVRTLEFRLGSQKIAALASGDPTKRVVLLLHGWLDNAGSFESFFSELKDFRCIAPDFPGHGLSQHSNQDYPYHFIDLVSFIDDMVVHLQQEKLDIVGHSMGGAAATLYASARPERVRSLVLLDSLGPLTESTDKTAQRIREHLIVRSSNVQSNRRFKTIEEAVQYRVRSSIIPTSERAAHSIVSRGIRKTEAGLEWSHDSRLKWPSAYRFSEEQLNDVISQIQCPTLVVRADPGIGLSQSQWTKRLSSLRNADVQNIIGNHHIHIDEQTRVGQWVREFLMNH